MKKLVQLLAIVFSIFSLGFVSCSDDKDDSTTTDPEVTNSAVEFTLPDFSESNVYLVKDASSTLAEICKEYIPAFSKEKQAIVAYPYDQNDKADYTRGFVVDNGGSIRWNSDGTYVYTAGNSSAVTKLYVDSNKIITVAEPLKVAVVQADQLKDYDGNIYGVVKIGTQYWMASNLKVTHYKDGKQIRTKLEDEEWEAEWEDAVGTYIVYDLSTDWGYDPEMPNPKPITDDISTREKITKNYGLLYNWYVASSSQIIPDGWALPSEENVIKLKAFLDNGVSEEESTAGGMMKEVGIEHWDGAEVWDAETETMVNTGENIGATNVSGFSAVGSGSASWGTSMSIKTKYNLWTSSDGKEDWQIEGGYKIFFSLSNDSGLLEANTSDKTDLKSVRFIRK